MGLLNSAAAQVSRVQQQGRGRAWAVACLLAAVVAVGFLPLSWNNLLRGALSGTETTATVTFATALESSANTSKAASQTDAPRRNKPLQYEARPSPSASERDTWLWKPGNCEPSSNNADTNDFARYCDVKGNPPPCRGGCAYFGTGTFPPHARSARRAFIATLNKSSSSSSALRKGDGLQAITEGGRAWCAASVIEAVMRESTVPPDPFSRGVVISNPNDGTSCDVTRLTPQEILEALWSGFRAEEQEDPFPVVTIVGDSLLRGFAMTLIAGFRGQAAAFDRMLHGSFRYTVTVDEDSFEFSDNPLNLPPRRIGTASQGTSLPLWEMRFHYIAFPKHVKPFPAAKLLIQQRPWLLLLGPQYQLESSTTAAASQTEVRLNALYDDYFGALSLDAKEAASHRRRRVYFLAPWYDDTPAAHVRELQYRNQRYRALKRQYDVVASHYLADTVALTAYAGNATKRRDRIHYACTQVGMVPDHVFALSRVHAETSCNGTYERLQWLPVLHFMLGTSSTSLGTPPA